MADKNAMKNLAIIFIFSLFAASCSQQIESFVDLKKESDPSTSTATPNGNKISGGGQIAAGSQVKTSYSIGFKDRTMTGSQFKTRVTITGNRPAY